MSRAPSLRSPQLRQARRSDEGSVLPLVLVLMVVSALIVVPLLSYAVSVLRANTVVSDATREREGAEAGLRVALLKPNKLFEKCDTGVLKTAPSIAAPDKIITGAVVATKCAQIDSVGPSDVSGFQDPVAVTVTQLGNTITDAVTGRPIASAPLDEPNELWWNPTPTATTDRVWLPALPSRPTSVRTSAGYAMPAAFDCRVYLPGYYSAPITLSSGNVYFASGIYYFENDIMVTGNANVVVGYGLADLPNECADDIQASANVIGNSGTFDIDGGGATWVFGGNARLVVDNDSTSSSLSLKFNQRYATEANGGRVSIMSVNGDDSSINDLVVDNVLVVPRSRVNSDPLVHPPVAGTSYVATASRYTPEPRLPAAPTVVAATPRTTSAANRGALLLTWEELTGTDTGGAAISAYTVTYRNAPNTTVVCSGSQIFEVADGVLGCVAVNLLTGMQSFRINATNAAGTSTTALPLTLPGNAVSAPLIAVPATMAAPSVSADPLEQYADAATVIWTPLTAPESSDVPVAEYRVSVERVWQVLDLDGVDPLVPPTEQFEVSPSNTCSSLATMTDVAGNLCVVTGLGPLPALRDDDPTTPYLGYRFVVSAVTAGGPSAPSPPSPLFMSFAGETYVAPADPAPPAVPAHMPEPIVDIQVAKAMPTTVSIPGYLSLPAARVNVENPRGHDVRLNGGILVSSLTINDSRAAAGPESLPIGIREDIVLQRRIRLISSTGKTSVTAVVQINENGDYRINSWVVS